MNTRYWPIVSIIVPIFNVSLYIEQCVYSLLNQDYQGIEIILIDDGSPDDCGMIIDRLSAEDSRIIAIHQENRGVSAARNEGLKIARGEYIMFVDGDDYVEPDYVSYFLSLVNENGCDIGVGKNAFHSNESVQVQHDLINVVDSTEVIEGIYLNKYSVAVWNKIFKRDIIIGTGLLFNTDYWYAEGMLFNIMYLQDADRAVIGERKVYHVRQNPKSATRLFKLNNQYCGLKSMEYQKKHWRKVNQGILTAWEYHYRMYAKHILCGLITTNRKEQEKKLFRKCIRILRSNIRIPLQANISTRMKEDSILLAICPTGFIRDEVGVTRNRGDQSDVVSRRLLSVARHRFDRLPFEKKEKVFSKIATYLNKHYRTTYMERTLL